MNQKKVLIIGLDSATFDIIHPLIKEGRLPNIAKLMRDGAWGELNSTMPPVTYPAWQSFMTGKNPGKHGVFFLAEPDLDSYEFKVTPPDREGVVPFWEILNRDDKKLVLVEVPYTYPPRKVNGAIIAGRGRPPNCKDYTYPHGLREELRVKIGTYSGNPLGFSEGTESEFLEDLLNIFELKTKNTLYMMEKFDWDLFAVVFMQIDIIQHFYWKCVDKNHPKYDKKLEKYRDSINKIYEKSDKAIGAMLEKVDNDTTVVIMSDHGAGPFYKAVNLNEFLKKIGLMNLTNRSASPTSFFRQLTLKYELRGKIFRISDRIGTLSLIKKISWIIPRKVKKAFNILLPDMGNLKNRSHSDIDCIDWSNTKAFANSIFIRINLKGKYSKGIVEQGKEYEKIRDFIITELYKLEDPGTGTKVVRKVYKREEIYQGKYVDSAPDLILSFNDTYEGEIGVDKLFSVYPKFSGNHRRNGILIMCGKDIKESTTLGNAEIIDVAPTILHLMGFGIPDDMDGKVLVEAIEDGFLHENEIKLATYDYASLSDREKRGFTDEEERGVRERLKALGYDV